MIKRNTISVRDMPHWYYTLPSVPMLPVPWIVIDKSCHPVKDPIINEEAHRTFTVYQKLGAMGAAARLAKR